MHSLGKQELDIKAWFQALSAGDLNMFEFIFQAYKERAFGVAIKILKSPTEAEDIVQEVFLAVWQSRVRLNEIYDPEAWLFTITYNAVYTRLRKAARNQEIIDNIIYYISRKQNLTEEVVATHEMNQLVQEALGQLSPQQRTVYELSKEEGLSYHEIADHLHISKNTVRNHLASAIKTVRAYLRKWALPLLLLLTMLFY